MKNIILIGMSGVGKSEKGKYLANTLGWDFIDTDMMIEEKENEIINDIFTKYGEDYFREVEMKIIKEVSALNNTVIATGGGIVTRQENIQNLRENGYIFLLLGKIQGIVDNLNKSSIVRPLLKDSEDLYNKVEKLFKSREKLYLDASDEIIHVDNKSLEDISEEILYKYELRVKFD